MDVNVSAAFEARFDGVFHEVDEDLFELVLVGGHDRVGPTGDRDGETFFEGGRSADAVARSTGEIVGCGSLASREQSPMNRLSASTREEITCRPRLRSLRQSSGRGSWSMILSMLPGERSDGSQRIVELVSDDPDQPFPRGQLLGLEGTADVGQHHELAGSPVLPETAATHFPPPRRVADLEFDGARGCARKTALEPEFLGRRTEKVLCPGEDFLAGGVHLAQSVGGVECEDRDIDLGHHLAHESGGLEILDPLSAEGFCQVIELGDDLAVGIGAGDVA